MSLSDEKNCNNSSAIRGIVFNIQKFCTNDGPGIRTTVFLKGCPLHCAWCHNPESQKQEMELLYDASKCITCGQCAVACGVGAHVFENGVHTVDRAKCVVCGNCCESCPTDALELVGKEQSVDEVMQEVLRDKIFYDNSDGGLTLSGGEPLMQFDFAMALLKEAKNRGVHTCVETCGYIHTDHLCQVLDYIDLFLFDWKVTNPDLHKQYTGGNNALIRKNLQLLDEQGSQIILRCPIIPDVNDTVEHFEGIAELANGLKNLLAVEIEPYHSLGNAKHQKLDGQVNPAVFRVPEDREIEGWIGTIGALTDKAVRKA